MQWPTQSKDLNITEILMDYFDKEKHTHKKLGHNPTCARRKNVYYMVSKKECSQRGDPRRSVFLKSMWLGYLRK